MLSAPAIQNRSEATEPTEIRECAGQRNVSVGSVASLLFCIAGEVSTKETIFVQSLRS
jgi:hypothetical protein